jgi:hypothetical protein
MSVEFDEDQLVAEVGRVSEEAMEEAMGRWFTASQRRLQEAAGNRANIDSSRDRRGSLTGRQQQDLWKIGQTAQPPTRQADGSITFTYMHPAAVYHEWGTEPHEITGNPTLHFPWPDAPDEVVAMFTPGGEDEVNRSEWDGWVHFPSVDHPGNPAIGYVRHGRRVARKWLEAGDYR